MEKLVDELVNLSLDDEIIGLYDAEVEAEKVRKTIIEGAQMEGREAGLKEGREEKIRMIKSLHENGVSIEVIASSAEISIEEVKEILNIK